VLHSGRSAAYLGEPQQRHGDSGRLLDPLRFVKYAASGSEALMAMDPIVFRQMAEHVDRAEEDGSEAAKLKAYAALKEMIAWLKLSDRA
jgi:hypothetical protein